MVKFGKKKWAEKKIQYLEQHSYLHHNCNCASKQKNATKKKKSLNETSKKICCWKYQSSFITPLVNLYVYFIFFFFSFIFPSKTTELWIYFSCKRPASITNSFGLQTINFYCWLFKACFANYATLFMGFMN